MPLEPPRVAAQTKVLAAVALWMASAVPVTATFSTLAGDADLLARADLTVRAVVQRLDVVDEGDRIVTEATMRVVETLAGPEHEELVVRVLGGELPSGEKLVAWGAPRFAPGESVLLFLRARPGGTFRVLYFDQGVFREAARAGGTVWVRELRASRVGGAPGLQGGDVRLAGPRHGGRFLDWLRDRAAGRVRAVDYFDLGVAHEADGPAAAAEEFELLTASGAYIRWLEFDSGGQVTWRRNERGQPGLFGGGTAEFAAALAAWNDEPHSPVRYVDGGTTPIETATANDGVNVIAFDDPHDDIDGNRCEGGAGPAGIAIFRTGPVIANGWRGNDVEPLVDAGVIINDGISCHPQWDSTYAAELYTHELGHTLGLGHSHSGHGNPWAQVYTAMAPGFNDIGARILPDDTRGLRFLYDPSFTLVDCTVEGTEDYCSEAACGPCGPEQGDCDDDSQCLVFLNLRTRCVDNVGPLYGFAPGFDVCLEGVGPPPPAAPEAPSALEAAAVSPTAVELGWVDNAEDETDFLVESASPVHDFAPEAVAGANASGTVVEGLVPGRPYTFRVRARNASGASPASGEASATPLADPTAACSADEDTLCLLDGRFRVEVAWRSQYDAGENGAGGVGTSPVGGTKTGVFSFFDPANVELIVKALDASGEPQPATWFFYGALSTVGYWITVTDTATGASRTYHNPPGELCGFADTGAFPVTASAPHSAAGSNLAGDAVAAATRAVTSRPEMATAGACTPAGGTLCLADGRFAVSVDWHVPHSGASGHGVAVPGTDVSGYFWFFDDQNVELAVKVLDNSQSPAANWWVFYGALSDVGYTIRVLDTATGLERAYTNAPGNFCGQADTVGFPDE